MYTFFSNMSKFLVSSLEILLFRAALMNKTAKSRATLNPHFTSKETSQTEA